MLISETNSWYLAEEALETAILSFEAGHPSDLQTVRCQNKWWRTGCLGWNSHCSTLWARLKLCSVSWARHKLQPVFY